MTRISPRWVVFFGVVWWMLQTPREPAWVAGGLGVAAGLVLHLALGGRSGARISLRGLAAFVPFFLLQSVRGGIDVARRAFSPSLPLSPAFLHYPIRLQDETARVLFINTISLLPGTFSADLQDRALTVHLLSADPEARSRLAVLEDQVARVFSLSLPPPTRRDAGDAGDGTA
jgi:multicomponent Na+:H+ antiporter subunit E